MATKTIKFSAETGLTLTAYVYALDADTLLNTGGDTCTEATNAKGEYSFSMTEAVSSATHKVVIKEGTLTLWPLQYVYLTDTASNFRCEDSKGAVEALKPTTLGATLDVTATGAAGIDWGNVENKTTTNVLSGTTVSAATTVGGLSTSAAQTVAGVVWGPDYDEVAAVVIRAALGLGSADLDTQLDAILAALNAFITHEGTAQAGAAGSITLESGASASDDFYNGGVVIITSGTGAVQLRQITDYAGATRVATVDTNWITNPDSTSIYKVLGRIV